MIRTLSFLERTLGVELLRVNKSLNTVYQVKIIGFESDNGRRYTPEALKNARKLYEGIKVNVDHPPNPDDSRSVYDRIGKLSNIKFIEGKGLFGDLWLLPSHKMTPEVYDAAALMPDMFGLSHNAQGEGEDDEDGIFVVHKITEVRHVDLVADPATTRSLSESRKTPKTRFKMAMKEEDKEPMEAEYEDKETEEAADMSQQVIDIMTGDGSDEEKASAIIDLCSGDKETQEADEPEDEDTKEGDSEVSEAQDDEMEDDEETEEEDDPKEASESKKYKKQKKNLKTLQEQLNLFKKQLFIRRLFEANKIPVEKKLMEELKNGSYSFIRAMVKKLAIANKSVRPKSGSPVMEQKSFKMATGTDVYQWLLN